MRTIEDKLEFEDFYKKAKVVKDYDHYRTSSIRKRVIRANEKQLSLEFVRWGKPILEVGFGTGFITKDLALLASKVFAIDTSEEMLKLATEKLSDMENVELKIGNIFDLSLINQKFTTAISIRVFIHLGFQNSRKALSQLSSKVENNGSVIFDIPSFSVIKHIIFLIKSIFHKGEEVKNFNYSKKDIVELVASCDDLQLYNLSASDHIDLLFPLYFCSYMIKSAFLEKLLVKLEWGLRNFHYGHARWFVVCKKVKK